MSDERLGVLEERVHNFIDRFGEHERRVEENTEELLSRLTSIEKTISIANGQKSILKAMWYGFAGIVGAGGAKAYDFISGGP